APEVFWGPMAYAIIGGLIVATALTLLFLPALYVTWFRIQEPGKEKTVRETAGEPVGPHGRVLREGTVSGE
ncbi:MAG: family transporter, partial [Microvirga sp.]|nr:family transporter [Microvirga sp.]